MESDLIRPYPLATELTQLFNLQSSLDTELAVAMYAINQHMNAERASIFLCDTWRQQLTSFSSLDLAKREIRISVSTGIAGWVFENRRPTIVNDAYNDSRFYSGVDDLTGFRTRNIICSPLIDPQANCLGTIQSLNNKSGDFTVDDLDLLDHIAGLVAVAIENCRRFNETLSAKNACQKVLKKIVNQMGSCALKS
jgi:adenylate cyclase